MLKPRIKICCIANLPEARMAVRAGASVLGLVGAMPSGPGVIDDLQIAALAAWTPPGVATFLLTSETLPESIADHHSRTRTSAVQLVDYVFPSAYPKLREAMPGVRLVQVIHVVDEQDVDRALIYADVADALLLDSGNPRAAVKELGGTGRVHNWDLSRAIARQVDKPVYLAGGLHAGNVAEAMDRVGPFGLDICSGVRTDGRLDERKLDALMEVVG